MPHTVRLCALLAFLNLCTPCGLAARNVIHLSPFAEPRDFADWDGSIEWLHKRVDEQKAQVIANDYVHPTEATDKWWFPLDEVDGKLVYYDDRNTQKICKEYPLQR